MGAAVLKHGQAAIVASMAPRDALAIFGGPSHDLVAGIPWATVLDEGGHLGPRWRGHALVQSHSEDDRVPYFPITETQIGRGLARCFEGRPERVRSFLGLIAEQAGRHDLTELIDASHTFRITVEAPVRERVATFTAEAEPILVDRRRRIDLLIEWTTERAPNAVVVIELKLDSRVSRQQLRPYGDHARRLARGMKPGLFLLTLTPDPAERRHTSWRPVRWFPLVRRWERRLAEAGDDDVQFAIFRADLWAWALSRRN